MRVYIYNEMTTYFNSCYHTADSHTKKKSLQEFTDLSPQTNSCHCLHYGVRFSCECLRLVRVWRQFRQRDFRESSNISLPCVQSWPLEKAPLGNTDGQNGSSSWNGLFDCSSLSSFITACGSVSVFFTSASSVISLPRMYEIAIK